ncbi:xylose operon transcription regulator XylR [Rhodopirellula sp. SWK7]|uniref:AraC family transcriptional regulator n=1 Tax=Rhodopirellula sp. SWK7 TaxID=595460 RepID=UPI0005C4D0DD|nr:DNA-binding transcriptional regulator [Rhodopirellula sp. SWK7]
MRSKRPKRSGYAHVLLALGWPYQEIHHGVARFARDNEWHVTADYDDPVPDGWSGDGVLTLLGAREDLWEKLRDIKQPIVDLTESRPQIALPRVTVDNLAIGKKAAQFFLDRGYTNFTFMHRWEMGVSQNRRQGFVQHLKEAGFECTVHSWQLENPNARHDRRSRHQWMVSRLTELPKPVAVFTARDTDGVEIIEACDRAGIRVPDEVAVLSVDNQEAICECLRCPLSSIEVDWELVGYKGAELLHQLINGGERPEQTLYVPPSSIADRESTNFLAVQEPNVFAALQFIHRHFHEPIQMCDIVHHIGISRSSLEKAFRAHFRRAPIEELRRIRFESVKMLLQTTDDSVANIALQSGFQSDHNLCRAFKREFMMTPSEFRNEARSSAPESTTRES